MTTGIDAFTHPLKPAAIQVGQQNFLLSGRILEHDLPLPIVSNLDLNAPDDPQIACREGLLLIEVQTTDVKPETVGHAIYLKSNTLMLAKLETLMFHHEFTGIFHAQAEKLTGLELLIPAYQNVDRDQNFLFSDTVLSRTSRTGIVEALLRTHLEIQRKKAQ